MATASAPLPPLPPPTLPLVDPKTGLVDRRWYEALDALFKVVRVVRTEV